MKSSNSIENLFRHESGKLISVLTKLFGPHNLQLAEDVVQDSLLKALDHWKFHGVPENPSAWLFTVARNKALDVIRQERHRKKFAPEVFPLLTSEYTADATLQQLLTPHQIEDEQLRMMFVCCHPSLPEEGQVALILKTLCGFSTAEIAHAFLTNEETITKRLYRAKEQFRNEAIAFALPSPSELQTRLENVLTAIYLIFNEGYHTAHHASIIREELIEESLRLGKMLVDNEITNLPITNSLMALLCFNTSRVYGRLDENGNLLQLKNQNRSKWNKQLIVQGNHYLNRAASIEPPTPYHIEAAIAYEHCQAATFAETNWQRIVELYDWLYQLKPMPLIQLNQLIALAEWKGAHVALAKLNDLQLMEQLPNNALLHAALGEWRLSIGEKESAKGHFEKAVGLSKTEKEKLFFTNRLRECY
ncbi:MAG: sigma-70 family RNA polymerase sigma factor [Chryseotalea sp. WA131a]|nr:MAG: sigma-70 family RNA polymerase sigma factor [Chryseotalea sp. WA131a]